MRNEVRHAAAGFSGFKPIIKPIKERYFSSAENNLQKESPASPPLHSTSCTHPHQQVTRPASLFFTNTIFEEAVSRVAHSRLTHKRLVLLSAANRAAWLTSTHAQITRSVGAV